MKKNKIITSILFFAISILIIPHALSQTLELSNVQNLAITNPGIYLFSQDANILIKEAFKTNKLLQLVFSNFTGAALTVAPVSDFNTIGTSKEVKSASSITLDFSNAPQSTISYGLSMRPVNDPAVFSLQILTNPSTSSSGGSTSSSGGTTSSSSSSGGTSTPISTSSGTFTKATISISAPETFSLSTNEKNIIKLDVEGADFTAITKCHVFPVNETLLKIRPKEFLLSKNKTNQTIRVSIPKPFAKNLILTNTSRIIKINITCKNGVSEEATLTINPQ